MKKVYSIILLLVLIFLVNSCGPDEYDVEYQVSSRLNFIPAKLVYIDSKQAEQVLQDVALPWNYRFKSEEGDVLKITANLWNTGNSTFVGKDTMCVKILLNGSSFKAKCGEIVNGTMEELSIKATIPE